MIELSDNAAQIVLERLHEAAKRFREYERLHLAKGTPESDAKAQVNFTEARLCEKAAELMAQSILDSVGERM